MSDKEFLIEANIQDIIKYIMTDLECRLRKRCVDFICQRYLKSYRIPRLACIWKALHIYMNYTKMKRKTAD